MFSQRVTQHPHFIPHWLRRATSLRKNLRASDTSVHCYRVTPASPYRVLTCHRVRWYTVLGDGEIEEGQVWEAAMFAAHYKLDNLVMIVDNNGLQIDGKISEVMSPYPIVDKFKAFGLHVVEADAHDFDSLEKAFNEAETVCGQPTVIVMKSTKGKGVSYMEDNVSWHGAAPNAEQYAQAVEELTAHLKELEG